MRRHTEVLARPLRMCPDPASGTCLVSGAFAFTGIRSGGSCCGPGSRPCRAQPLSVSPPLPLRPGRLPWSHASASCLPRADGPPGYRGDVRCRGHGGLAAWPLYGKGVSRSTHVPLSRDAPGRTRSVPPAGCQRDRRPTMDRLPPQRARDHRRRHGAQLPALTPPGSSAAEPPGLFRAGRGPGPQYRRQLRHQHQLAELRRGADDVVPVADARHRHPDVPVRRYGHGGGGRACAGICAAAGARHRQFLRRPRPFDPLRASATVDRGRSVPRIVRRGADPAALRDRSHPAGSNPGHRTGTSRVVRGDQRHERRRAVASSTPTPRTPSRTPTG